MEIDLRSVDNNLDVTVTHDSTRIDFGLLDQNESMILLQTLLDAASEIVYKYQHSLETTDKALDVTLECFRHESENG